MTKPYYKDKYCTIYHGDCREILPELPKVDLMLTDPPYGIGASTKSFMRKGKQTGASKCASGMKYEPSKWDNKKVNISIILSCINKGAFSCIWGGNYYKLPPVPSWLVWDKETGNNRYADAELAWTNYGCAVRLKQHLWKGMLRKGKEPRNHPTQKPLEIITWCIVLCPDIPQIILDPFMGSGTTLRAAKDLQRKCIGIEIEEKYCEIAAKRLAKGSKKEDIKVGKEHIKVFQQGFGL